MSSGDRCSVRSFDADSLRAARVYVAIGADDDVAALSASDFITAGAGDRPGSASTSGDRSVRTDVGIVAAAAVVGISARSCD
jgi:hypothetical protein